MKTLTLFALALLLTTAMALTTATAQEDAHDDGVVQENARRIVQLVYFHSSDIPVRPNVDAQIDRLIKETQSFFADEMERHGFGRKTFQFETDAQGNAVVHHVTGNHTTAHYEQNRDWWEEIYEQILIPTENITVVMLEGRPLLGLCGRGGGYPYGGGGATIACWDVRTLGHELGHAFGIGYHDFRKLSYLMSYGSQRELSPCFAEWLDVHPAFNPKQTRRDLQVEIQMLPATLAAPPNAIRLRFTVTAPAGALLQARLITREKHILNGYFINTGGLIGCQRLHGNPTRSTVEFVTTALTQDTTEVLLYVIRTDGSREYSGNFPIDVASLLPPAQVVSIPDAKLAAAVREALSLSSGAALTTHAMLRLYALDVRNRGIKDLTGLEHAVNLIRLDLGKENIDGEGSVNSNAVSDFSPLETLTNLAELNLSSMSNLRDASALANLTQLEWLYLYDTSVSDVSALANLTQLETLWLGSTAVSDVSALANLTQLKWLYLYDTAVSDVSALADLTQLETLNLWNCPLSYASLHTHIPALQAKGIEVEFDDVAHPALLKVTGDGQEGTGGAALSNPFVVEAMDEYGQPMGGVPVQFEMLRGGGTLSANTVQTDARGKAQVTLTLGGTVGINKVKATAEGIESWVLFNAIATEAAPQLAADVNGDGVVDLADLAIVAQAMGKPVENPRADVNGDGVVDGEDFAQVAANLGEGAAAPSSTALPAGFTREKGEWALNLLHAENTGSPAFRRGIAKLEGFLALLVPEKTLLLANYPNPFNPETWIPYQLANPADVTVTIYAANGAVVRTLELGQLPAGVYQSRSRAAYWDGRNAQGESVASGVYFYTLSAGEFSATRKMVIRK